MTHCELNTLRLSSDEFLRRLARGTSLDIRSSASVACSVVAFRRKRTQKVIREATKASEIMRHVGYGCEQSSARSSSQARRVRWEETSDCPGIHKASAFENVSVLARASGTTPIAEGAMSMQTQASSTNQASESNPNHER